MAIDLAIRRKIIDLHKQGKSCQKIADQLLEAKQTVWRTIKKFKDTGSVEDLPKPGRPRSVRTPKLIENVRQKLRSLKKTDSG